MMDVYSSTPGLDDAASGRSSGKLNLIPRRYPCHRLIVELFILPGVLFSIFLSLGDSYYLVSSSSFDDSH